MSRPRQQRLKLEHTAGWLTVNKSLQSLLPAIALSKHGATGELIQITNTPFYIREHGVAEVTLLQDMRRRSTQQ
jgi:hypothetical protein